MFKISWEEEKITRLIAELATMRTERDALTKKNEELRARGRVSYESYSVMAISEIVEAFGIDKVAFVNMLVAAITKR